MGIFGKSEKERQIENRKNNDARRDLVNFRRNKKYLEDENLLILPKNEKVIWKGIIEGYGNEYRLYKIVPFFIITSDNLFCCDRGGYDLVSFPLTDIMSINPPHSRDHGIVLTIIVKEKNKEFGIFFNGDNPENDHQTAYRILLDLVQKKKDESKKRENIYIDFSSIKKYLKNGGVVMQTFKCPGCGASLEFPNNVDTTTCQYCGNKIKAVDLFEKIRNLI